MALKGRGRTPPGTVSSPELAGRDSEMTLMRSALEDATEGRPSLTLLIGDAGVGKSRIVRELEAMARDAGMLALHGECLELSVGELPYAPIGAALRDADRASVEAGLSALPGNARAELARVFPDVAGQSPADATHDDRFGQSRLFGWILMLLRQLSATTPVLLAIEDLHWADTSSRDFLRFLVQSLRSERVAAVATVRSDELHREHPVRALITQLARSESVTRIDLGPLSEQAVGEQIAGILGATQTEELVHRLFVRAEGNPFYTEELLAAEASDELLPPTLRDALLLRTDVLGDRARALLRLLAAAGRPLDDRLIARAAGLPTNEVDAALRECIDQNVAVCDNRTGYYGFRHSLVREAVYGDLLPSQRVGLHGAVAEALDRAPSGDNAADRAHHWDLAHEPSRALLASIEAGLAAERVFGYGEALTHFARAIDLWGVRAPDPGATPLDLVSVQARAAQAARWMGESERARDLCRQALDGFEHGTDPVRAARLYERLGRYQPWDIEASLEAFRRALSVLPDGCPADRMRIYVDEALALSFQGRWNEVRAKATAALQLAEGQATVAIEAAAKGVLGVAVAFLGDPLAGAEHLRAGLDLARRADSTEDLAQLHLDLGEVLRLQGQTEEALTVMLDGERVAAGVGAAGLYGNFMAVNAADDLFRLGRWSELDERLRLLANRQLDQTAQLLLESVAGRLDTARGRFDQARARFEAGAELSMAADLLEFAPALYSGYAELELWQRQPAAARARISEGLAKLEIGENLLHTPWLHSMGARIEADLAELARLRRDAEEAQRAQHAATSHHDHLARLIEARGARATPPEATAHLASAAAELSRAVRGPDPTRWQTATSAWQALGNPYQSAYAAYRQAEALLLSRSERSRAQAALRQASALAAQLGAEPLSGEIRSLARRTRLGLGVEANGERAPSAVEPTKPFDLTERELEVLALLGAGLTNREISSTLFISQHTAGVHVSHILGKLGVPNRAMAAAMAERLGLVPRD